MPSPLTARGGIAGGLPRRIRRAEQRAAVQQRDRVGAIALVEYRLHHGNRRGGARHVRAELLARARLDPNRSRLLVANDAARDVPPAPERLVVAPREQRSPAIVLNQQIDVDE